MLRWDARLDPNKATCPSTTACSSSRLSPTARSSRSCASGGIGCTRCASRSTCPGWLSFAWERCAGTAEVPDPCSAPTVGLVTHPLGEPPDVRVGRERLQTVVVAPEVTVGERGVHVAVAGPAQVHRYARVAPPERAPGHPPAPHPPGLGARQEVVTGEGLPPDGPAAQLARLVGAVVEVLIVRSHPEIIRLVRAGGVASLTRGERETARSGGAPGRCGIG